MKEVWKDIKGYEGLYQVSNLGRVKSLHQRAIKRNSKIKINYEQILKPVIGKNGYSTVTLYKKENNNKLKNNYKIHRLVAESFLNNSQNFPQVNHIDENKQNNKLSNLQWVSSSQNNNHGTRNKRVAEKMRKPVCQFDMDGNLVKIWWSLNILKNYGFRIEKISEVCNNKKGRKSSGGFKWKYYDDVLNDEDLSLFNNLL